MRLNLNQSILLAILLALFSANASAQETTAPPSALTEIKTYTNEIDRFAKAHPKRMRTFVIEYESEKGRWRLLKGKSAQQVNESCDVWTRDGNVILAFFGFTSDSGDWYHFIKYYYRADGTLAKISARLNTFYGNVSVLRDRYYDTNGKLLKSTRRYLDIQTHKPVKTANFHDEPIPMYSNASALPFHKLL